jgi:cell division protein FtsI (penicillin-binding protein 3)
MEAAKNRSRLIVLTIILALCFIGLGCRLVDLQWARHDELRTLAENQHQHSYFREAPRGDIRDRRGNLLATSTPAKNICADPALLKGHEAEMARFLAPLLKTNETVLLSLLSRQTRTNTDGDVLANHWVSLKKKVSVDDWENLQAALGEHFTNSIATRKIPSKEERARQIAWLRSIYTEPDQIRTYPNGALAAHVLGFTGPSPIVIRGETNWITGGVEGIERTFDDKVRGTRGWLKTERTSRKQELFMFREQDVEARPGLNVVLTIDGRVQQIVEEELAPAMEKHSAQSVSAIVVRPRTGEILAMATLPTFDPNTPGKFTNAFRRNRVITDTFEPGSTFKTVTLAGALNDGVARLADTYDCENGAFFFAGKVLHDHLHYGVMSVEQIIAKSSNIGTAKVAIRLGQERTFSYIWDFGFGQRTGIPLPGESPGILPRPKDWKQIHISRIPIGQGVAATPLQMVMALSAIANGGVLMRPMLVDSLVDDKGQTVVKYQPQSFRRVVSEKTAKETIVALKSVVDSGTAAKAALENYTVAGKTGTAQKVVRGEYSHDKYYASFIGFFPADNPDLCIAVSIDEPNVRSGYYGAQTAAPVFKRIAERTANFLNIKPDLQPDRPADVMASDKVPEHAAMLQVRGKL